MKRVFLFVIIIQVLTISGHSQLNWKFSAKKIADKTYEVHLKATVNEPWHIYSQSTPKGVPLPTTIKFSKNPLVVLNGKAKENGEMEMYHDNIFDVDVYSVPVQGRCVLNYEIVQSFNIIRH